MKLKQEAIKWVKEMDNPKMLLPMFTIEQLIVSKKIFIKFFNITEEELV